MRLSKIITRTGDNGSTGLADGSRLPKHAPRIEAIGDVDELNSQLGLLLAESLDDAHTAMLRTVQNDLFDLGGELAMPGHAHINDDQVSELEQATARINESLPPLKEFVLPGGNRPAALAHVCRTVCRRAERHVVALGEIEPVSDNARRYLNRLSDLLFVLARQLNRQANQNEPLWRGSKPPK